MILRQFLLFLSNKKRKNHPEQEQAVLYRKKLCKMCKITKYFGVFLPVSPLLLALRRKSEYNAIIYIL